MTTTASGWDALQKRLDSVPKPVRTLKLCEEPEVRDRYLSAKHAFEQAERHLKALPKDVAEDARALVEQQHKDAKAELAAAQKAYDTATITLRFAALERSALEALQAKHPATEEDEARGTDFHYETFAPEVIAAASLDGMPLEYAIQAMQTWSLSDSDDLWNAAWSVQRRKRTDLGKG